MCMHKHLCMRVYVYTHVHRRIKSSPFRWVPDKLVSVQDRENFDFGVPGNTLVVIFFFNLRHTAHTQGCVFQQKKQ